MSGLASASSSRFDLLGSGYLLPLAQLNSSTRSSLPTSPCPSALRHAASSAPPSGHSKNPSSRATSSTASTLAQHASTFDDVVEMAALGVPAFACTPDQFPDLLAVALQDRLVHIAGDRRDHFETSTQVWELFRTIVRERKEREFDPTVTLLRELANDPALEKESPALQDRLRSTLDFMQTLGSWSEEMLRLSPATVEKILRLGAQVQRFVRPGEADAAASVFPVTPPMPPMG